jgi:hypothetical protein
MPAFLYSIPNAIAGAMTRGEGTVEPNILASADQPTAYGLPVAIESGKIRAIKSGDDASDVFGFLVRPFPTTSLSDDFGGGTPPTKGIVSIVKRGYLGVQVNAGTPAKGGAVYVRVANASGAKVIGGVEAAADSTNTVALTNAYFTGATDISGVAEVAYNL